MAAISRAILVFIGLAAASLAIGVADAVAASGTLYVTDYDSPGEVVPVPLSTLTAGSAITSGIGMRPVAVAVSPNASRAFAANLSSATMSAIDTAANTAQEVDLTKFGGPIAIAVSPNGSQVFLAMPFGVAIVNAHTLAVNSSLITIGNSPYGIAFTPNGKFAYVANNGDGTVSVIDTSSDTVTKTISLGLPANPCALAVTPDGAKVVVIGGCFDATGGVSIISTATNNATAIGSLGTHPFEAVAMSPNGKAAYVYDNTTGDIWQVDPRTGATPANPLVNGAGGIRGLALSPSGSRLFATRSGSGTVSMINPLSGAITPISSVTGVPWGDAVTPDQAPHAALSATAAPAGSATKLSAAGTTTYDGGAAKYAWSFGDGSSKTTTTPTVSHVYAKAGDYTARVTVTDDQGCATKLIYTGQTASCNGGSSAKKSVTIAVPAPTRTLTVAKAGAGSGTVTSSPAGISCGSTCSHAYANGTVVKLTATPSSGSVFAGWSGGGCSGTGTCTVTMSADRSVTASLKKKSAAGPPDTKITKAKINNKHHKAKFRFTGSGGVPPLAFKCKLTHQSKKLKRWRRCSSPNTYKHLMKGRHILKVKAVDSRGTADPTPAKKRFRVA